MNNNDGVSKSERQGQIRKLVEKSGRVTVPELSEHFDVSEATIRRDLEELDGKGWVHRTHGGALRAERVSKELPMMQRMSDKRDEKSLIGKAAATLIEDGQTIFLGSGTTVLEVAYHLPKDIVLTVITNSLPIINHLVDYPNIELIVVGGMFRKSELSMVGHIAENAVKEFRADQVFMGIHALDAHHGLTNDFLPETMTDRAIVEIAPRVVIVADHTKFGRVSTVLVAETSVANIIVTDRQVPEDIVLEFVERGIEVIQAS